MPEPNATRPNEYGLALISLALLERIQPIIDEFPDTAIMWISFSCGRCGKETDNRYMVDSEPPQPPLCPTCAGAFPQAGPG